MFEENGRKIRLTKGEITERKLVEKLCTPKQISKYNENGKFKNGQTRRQFLANLSRFCEYEYDVKGRKCNITNVFTTQVPKPFGKLNTGVSKYLTPLILQTLLDERTKEPKSEIHADRFLTLTKWAKKFNMINENYGYIKRNLKTVSEIHGLDIKNTTDFMERMTNCITYYIPQALERLSNSGVITYHKEMIICINEYEDIELEGQVVKGYKYEVKRLATSDEAAFIQECMSAAEKAAKIEPNNRFQRYFSVKSIIYKGTLKEELAKRNIKYAYEAFGVFIVSGRRCRDVLNMFNVQDFDAFKAEFADYLKASLKENCGKRHEKTILTHQDDAEALTEDKQKALHAYDTLSDIVISRNANPIAEKFERYKRTNGIAEATESGDSEYTVEIINMGARI